MCIIFSEMLYHKHTKKPFKTVPFCFFFPPSSIKVNNLHSGFTCFFPLIILLPYIKVYEVCFFFVSDVVLLYSYSLLKVLKVAPKTFANTRRSMAAIIGNVPHAHLAIGLKSILTVVNFCS